MIEAVFERAQSHDIAAIDDLQRRFFNNPWQTSILEACLTSSSYRTVVLRDNLGGIVGYYIASSLKEHSNLDAILVDEGFRAQGYGETLFKHWVGNALAGGYKKLSLQVDVDNAVAVSMYRKHHFAITKLRFGYYPNGQDAFEMSRTIAKDKDQAPALAR